MRRFDALVVGERRRSEPVLLDEASIIGFARAFDPQWFHIDPRAARESAFGGLIASGAHLIALWRRIDHDLNGDIAFYCGVALEDVRFRVAGRPGDLLILQSEILDCRPSRDPGRGLVKMGYSLSNQTDRVLLELTAINLVYR